MKQLPKETDVAIIGAGHNGLVAAIILARAGLSVSVFEERGAVGGAVRTEYPFSKAPNLGVSSGAYLLGLMPPEIVDALGLELSLIKRDPHYFLPTTDGRHLLFGSDQVSMRNQFLKFFSEADWKAHEQLQDELAKLRDDIAPTWLREPLSIEATAAQYVRPALQSTFISLCRGTIANYLDRFEFKSDLIRAMYAVTDAFSGLSGGFDTPGTGMNFLIHNMCRLPGSSGTWLIVRGGMGQVTEQLAARAQQFGAQVFLNSGIVQVEKEGGHFRLQTQGSQSIKARLVMSNADPYRTRSILPQKDFDRTLSHRLDSMKRPGTTLKVNLALRELPKFTCLPEDRGQYGPTIHLLPDEANVISSLRQAHTEAMQGKAPDFPSIEWYFHTPLDKTLQDDVGRHNSALFVQWVPNTLASGRSWETLEESYAKHLLSICDRFAPGTSALVDDMFVLSPQGIERHFGITAGHIHHIDNSFGFADRAPYRFGIDGVYLCSAGTHPAGSVIGAGGWNAAHALLSDIGKVSGLER